MGMYTHRFNLRDHFPLNMLTKEIFPQYRNNGRKLVYLSRIRNNIFQML